VVTHQAMVVATVESPRSDSVGSFMRLNEAVETPKKQRVLGLRRSLSRSVDASVICAFGEARRFTAEFGARSSIACASMKIVSQIAPPSEAICDRAFLQPQRSRCAASKGASPLRVGTSGLIFIEAPPPTFGFGSVATIPVCEVCEHNMRRRDLNAILYSTM
jgi:hypothetical protein